MARDCLISDFFRRLNKILMLSGISNLSMEDTGYSRPSQIFIGLFWKIVSVCLYLFVTMELIAFFTQTNLTEKQNNDILVFGLSHPLLVTYYLSIDHYHGEIKTLLNRLTVELKQVYNDMDIERKMIKKFKLYAAACICSFFSSLISYGFDGLMQWMHGDGTFITVITAWPKVEDNSLYANISRIASYLVWWLFMTRVSGVYILIVFLIICLSYQYKHLQCYFYSLDEIFSRNELTHVEKEEEYEKSLKVGIQLHADTLWCTEKIQTVCATVFSGQILLNISVFCLLMMQMMNSERTFMNALAIVSTGIALLISTGFFMWSAGDVTVEAAQLTFAMYSSGWEKCRGNRSTRIRRLLVVAMKQSQKPVVLRSFRIMELSYQSYLSIVKTSYSVFSILY